MSKKENWTREKRWKDLPVRSTKLARAEQLGFHYPLSADQQLLHDDIDQSSEQIKALFVCSRNQWRSPTAEQLWRKHPKVQVRSGGTSPSARHSISENDIRWSSVIFVMEQKHKSRLLANFARLLANKPIHVLDIPDEYKFMDPELIELLEQSVNSILGLA